MSNESISMLPVLPCGVPFDSTKGECCVTNCGEEAVRAEKDPKLRFRAIEACRFWNHGKEKAVKAGKKAAISKSPKK